MSNEAPPKLDEAAILAKANKGETLTPEESEFIAGAPEGQPVPAAKEKTEVEEEPGAEAPAPDEGEEKPEGEEPPAEEPAAEKPEGEEKPAEGAAKETPEQRRELINAELEKPDDKVDLSKFTPVEIGLYWDLKKTRRKNQALDAENRDLRFKDVQRRLKERGKPAAEEPPAEEVEEEDPLAGREDEDLLTVADVKKLLGGKGKPGRQAPPPLISATELRLQRVEANTKLKDKGITDFNEVVDLAQEALEGDEDARLELQETALNGGNIAEKTYYLIKGSKKWPEIEKRLKPAAKPGDKKPPVASAEDLARAKKLKDNAGKTRTTGAPSGGGAQPGEFTVEEVAAMSPAEFGRLPKKTQDAILWKFGSTPNLD